MIKVSKITKTSKGGMVAAYVATIDGVARRCASFLPKAVRTIKAARAWLMSTIKTDEREEVVTLSPVEALVMMVHAQGRIMRLKAAKSARLIELLEEQGITAQCIRGMAQYRFTACGFDVTAEHDPARKMFRIILHAADAEQIEMALHAKMPEVPRSERRLTEREQDMARQWGKANRWYHAIVNKSDLTGAERERFRSHVKAAHDVASMKDMTPAQLREVCARLRNIPRSTMGDTLRGQMRGAI